MIEGIEDVRNSGYANGKVAVLMGIGRQPGANIIETVDKIMALLPELKASIPPTVVLDTNYNRTTTIRASVKDIEFTLLLTVALVVMVIFLLFAATHGPPLFQASRFLFPSLQPSRVMYLLHYNLDNLSLMASGHLHRICEVDDAHRGNREHYTLSRRGAFAVGSGR